MEQRPARVLLIDEDEADYQLIQAHAASMPRGFCELRWVDNYASGRAALCQREFDVCLLNCSGSETSGLELLRDAIASGCREPIIVITGVADPLLDLEAMKAGAADYLVKEDFDANRLERVIRHATERARLLKALAHERHLLYTLMDNIPDNIYFKDSEGRYLRVNRAKAVRSGLQDPAEAVGRSDFDFFPTEHARRTLDDERRLMQTGETIIGQEERLVWPSGEVSWASTTKVPFRNEQGRIIGTLGVSRDITRLKAAQDALREAKEAAEAASRAKSEFLANISHEVRTPMNAILGMTELVLDTPLSSSQRENLRIAYESAQSLLEMLDDILNFSEIEAGNLELCNGAFNVRQCVADVLQSLRPRAVQKGLELRCDIAADTPELVVGDVNRLQQVLVNLVGNAIKFTEQGHVATTVTHRPESEGRVSLEFSVTDTGVGIPPDKLEAIFEAFQQADNSPTRRFGGPGLGLTISSRLVRLMGGTIEVESIERRGSRFRFSVRLPAAAADQPESARPSRPPLVSTAGSELPAGDCPLSKPQPTQEVPVIPRLRVLLAEDSLFNQKLAVGLLEKWGHEIVVAINGVEAVELARASSFDLVLMDVQMPQMDGYEATRLIRADELHSGQHIPIIAMTAHAMSGDRDRCLEAGMDGYVAKPVYARNLQSAIGDVLHRVACRSSAAPADTPSPTAEGPVAVDWEAAVAGVDGRRDLLAELIEIFFTEYPELLTAVQQAVDQRDAIALRTSAHRLKGCLRYFGDNRAGALAMKLEEHGRTGDWTGVPGYSTSLRTAIQQMLPELQEFHDRETGVRD